MAIFNFLVNFLVFLYVLCTASANLLLIGKNISIGFNDFRANFAPAINPSGKCGVLHMADPTDACSSLNFKMLYSACECSSPFVLIERGGCSFEVKVRKAQAAGFKAAIVYDNEDDGVLVAMAGNPVGIKINAVFISKVAGGIIRSYIGVNDTMLWIYPSFENSAWSIMAISFLSLLAMAAVFTACFIIRRRISRRDRPMLSRLPDSHGMSGRLVKAMPSLIFTSALEDNCTSTTCAICLEDYSPGENLRLLPCLHKFHSVCVDSWLTSWRTFCPVCKQDARATRGGPPPSESTPLLLWSNPPSALSSSGSSFSSSSSALQAAPALSFPNPAWAPPLAANWGSLTHQNTSPCHLASFGSLCCPSMPCLSSSNLYGNSLPYSDSAPTLSSALSSANSLPPC